MTRLNGTERRTRRGVQGVLALCLSVAGTTLAVLGVAVPSATAAPAPLGIYVGNGAATNTVTSYPLSSNGNVAPNTTIGSSSSSIDGPDGQVFDANGDLWVANNAGNTVVEFTAAQLAATGSPTPNVTISSDGSGSGVFSGPAGLAFDSSGDLWVANNNVSTLVEYTPSQLAVSGSPTPAAAPSSTTTALSRTWWKSRSTVPATCGRPTTAVRSCPSSRRHNSTVAAEPARRRPLWRSPARAWTTSRDLLSMPRATCGLATAPAHPW